MKRLIKHFIHPTEIPNTNEDWIIEGIQDLAEFKNKVVAQQQQKIQNDKGNYRGSARNNYRDGKRGNYSNYNGNNQNNAQQRGYKGNSGNNQRKSTYNGLCHYCNEPGHIRLNYPLRQLDYEKLKVKNALVKLVHTDKTSESCTMDEIKSVPLVKQQVICNGQVEVLIDTGASLSTISPVLLKKNNSEGKPYVGPLLIMASGQEVKPEKEMDIIVEHPSGATAKATVAVLDFIGNHLLLGNDILRQFHKNIKTMTQQL